MLVANTVRGDDASGVATVAHKGGCTVLKRAIDAYSLVDLPAFSRTVRATGLDAIIGHTRLGTHGKNIDRNAHPFRERTVVGAHNGIIMNHDLLANVVEPDDWRKPAKVDSQQVFRILASAHTRSKVGGYGAEYARLLPLAEGTMALTWVDTRDPGYVYLFRHDNPLSLAVVPAASTAYWSSQEDHLGAALQAVYGSDWYLVTLKPDTVYRVCWAKADLMHQTWAVDMPKWQGFASQHGGGSRSVPAVYGTYEDTNLIGGDDCEVCGLSLGEGSVIVEDDRELCMRCAVWWSEHGATIYSSVEEMKAISDTAGIGASKLLERKER